MCSWQAPPSSASSPLVPQERDDSEDLEGDTFCRWAQAEEPPKSVLVEAHLRVRLVQEEVPENVSKSPRASPKARLTPSERINLQSALLEWSLRLNLLRHIRREFQQSCFGQFLEHPQNHRSKTWGSRAQALPTSCNSACAASSRRKSVPPSPTRCPKWQSSQKVDCHVVPQHFPNQKHQTRS